MKTLISRLGSLWLWGGILIGFLLAMLFGSLAGHGFLSFICWSLTGLLCVYKALELLKSRKWAVITQRVLTGLVCLGVLIVGVTGVIVAQECDGDPKGQHQYLIVLGAGVHGTTPSLSLASRLEAAAEYMKEYPDTICIVSGGQGPGEDITEAQCMYDYLVAEGIDPSHIWMEDRSTSTQENLEFSMALIEKETGTRPQSIHLLSNEYHLFRAKIFARQQWVEASGVPAKSPYFTLFLNYFLREIAGVWHEILIGG